jgi:hypothetical protein
VQWSSGKPAFGLTTRKCSVNGSDDLIHFIVLQFRMQR